MRIRLADPSRDAIGVAAVYAPVVEETHISFEETAPSPAEMERRMATTLETTPWLVAEDGGIAGYAYAVSHRQRAAYRFSVDISVYLAADRRGQGLGRRMYGELLAILDHQGFVNVYAGVGLPNPASEALHRAIGMTRIGVYEGVGYKRGRWWDVAWYGMRIREPAEPSPEPVPLPRLRQSAESPTRVGPSSLDAGPVVGDDHVRQHQEPIFS